MNLGGSRSLTDTWTYVQPTEPGDRRNGVQWVDSSTNVLYIYSGEYGDWMRQSRVWVQDTAPTPRVGPLDGDQWIDSSTENRVIRVYSGALSDWVQSIPSETMETSVSGGWQKSAPEGLGWWNNDTGSYDNFTGVDPSISTDSLRKTYVDGARMNVTSDNGITGFGYTDVDGNLTWVTDSVNEGGWDSYTFDPVQIEQWEFQHDGSSTTSVYVYELQPHRVALPPHTHNL